jgi:hypothetical protein
MLLAQVAGGFFGVVAALIAWWTRREQRRLRKGFLALADESRREIREEAVSAGFGAKVDAAVAGLKDGSVTPDEVHEMPAELRELVARKYRIDKLRDLEWNAAGKPAGIATGRPI